jgi:hypothetical protein
MLSTLTFREFLTALIRALDRESVRFCVLRNYEKFPGENTGNDVDFLIHPSQLPAAIRALRSVPTIRIVGYSERPNSVVITFLEGVISSLGTRALQVDFNMCLTWKGLPILTTEEVLQAAITNQAEDLRFLVPSEIHEAIISLLSSLLVGGWLKEKYFPKVQRAFADSRSESISALQVQFGKKTSTHLVDAVIAGDRAKLLGCVHSLRQSLLLGTALHRPLPGVISIIQHYLKEFKIRFSRKTLETICIVSPEANVQSILAENLTPKLKSMAKIIEMRAYALKTSGDSTSQSGGQVFMAKAVWWLVKDWASQFKEKKNLTIRISQSNIYDLTINPHKYDYIGPLWFALLMARLSPSPMLWLQLDLAGKYLDAMSQQNACRSTVGNGDMHAILDATKSHEVLLEAAYEAIVNALAKRASNQIERCLSRG